MILDLEPEKGLPRGSKDLGNGYCLLRARDSVARWPPLPDQDAIQTFLVHANAPDGVVKVRRWARLALPNGKIARSRWKEQERELEKVRMAHNVQVCIFLNHQLIQCNSLSLSRCQLMVRLGQDMPRYNISSR